MNVNFESLGKIDEIYNLLLLLKNVINLLLLSCICYNTYSYEKTK
jgi:hypothetical protein